MPIWSLRQERRFAVPLPRLVGLVSSVALFAHMLGSAFAEQPSPPRNAQLDRIEQKLDDVLKRLGAASFRDSGR
jgi:hypothetical protein